ncbi:MAG: PVC-type heme-binding CxxCH protein [Planctomycetales bacterium]|jgi:putative membrane-bound dehydrogenase-like protein
MTTPAKLTCQCLFLAAFTSLCCLSPEAGAQDVAPPAQGWHLVTIPDAWRKMPGGDLKPIDGYSWYRCLVQIPESWSGAKLTLFTEAIDDARASYVNGVKVGAIGTFPPQFRSGLGEKGRYDVDADLIEFGKLNTIGIRVYQDNPRPNFSVAPPILMNESAKQAIRMDGDWQYRPGDNADWSKSSPAEFGVDAAKLAGGTSDRKRGAFAKVDDVDDLQRYVLKRKGDNDPVPPDEAEKQFETPNDLDIQLVLSEPHIAQPLFMNWDERGRLWVMEYRQYPEIAGLKMLSRDVYLRAVYDKVPKAPPNHVKGRDRISIHEDTDGDGVYDKHKIFVDGLNLATSFVQGRGGLFVANPPYLLFYPDKDGDDVPDGDPEVHLEGFGMEDSHSVVNSLRFGPDGWLYGAQGSTVSGNIKRPGSKDKPIRTMGQLIWRYHPELHRYEVFAEGGGNTFGVEISEKGEIFSGHNGGNTRGFHYEQGGYSRKGFGKHGPLSNPYAFGYFANMKHHSVPRFTHNFVIYEENVLPDEYRGRLFGIEPLQGQVVMSDFQPDQSSFQTRDISRVVKTNDQWFRPVDIKTGPDGCIYIADLYEQRIDHSSHYAGRIDRTNGRIYRLKPKDLPKAKPFDYGKSDFEELVKLLEHHGKWHRQTAQRIIADKNVASRKTKPTPKQKPLLDFSGFGFRLDTLFAIAQNEPIEKTFKRGGQTSLEAVWWLNSVRAIEHPETAKILLAHEDQFVRAWTVRLLCDHYEVEPKIAKALADLAAKEPYIEVRKQLASSARRLPAKDALPIIRNLLNYDEDSKDLHQPLMLWWAIEAKASDGSRKEILDLLFADKDVWNQAIVKEHLIDRMMKRYALAGSRDELIAAAELLNAAPDKASTDLLLKGFEEAYKGRSLAGLPDQLVAAIAKSGGGSTALKLRQGDAEAIKTTVTAVETGKGSAADRLQYLQIFGEIRRPEFIPVLLKVVDSEKNADLVSAALTALQAFDDLRVGQSVVKSLIGIPGDARLVAETLLGSRPVWAIELLEAVDSGELKPEDVSDTALRKILLHDNSRIGELVEKHWGSVAGATTDEMRQEVERLMAIVEAASGNPKKGKVLYMENCGKCHTLFTEGGKVGPDLTSFKRDNLERVMINVVNPSLEIREGFENYIIVTTDGRVVNGFLADKDSQVVVLRGVDGQNLIFRRDEIEDMRAIKRSVMPEGSVKKLTDQQIRDLFAYLRASQPVNY